MGVRINDVSGFTGSISNSEIEQKEVEIQEDLEEDLEEDAKGEKDQSTADGI